MKLHLRAMGYHFLYGITVLPATRHMWTHSALTQAIVWYSIFLPRRDGGWLDLADQLHTEMVYPPRDGHPSK